MSTQHLNTLEESIQIIFDSYSLVYSKKFLLFNRNLNINNLLDVDLIIEFVTDTTREKNSIKFEPSKNNDRLLKIIATNFGEDFGGSFCTRPISLLTWTPTNKNSTEKPYELYFAISGVRLQTGDEDYFGMDFTFNLYQRYI